MTDFKAKMHQIRFRLGLCPRPHWGLRSRGKDGLGKRRETGGGGSGGREREGPKLLLNQGHSEPCYATVQIYQFPGCLMTDMDDSGT